MKGKAASSGISPKKPPRGRTTGVKKDDLQAPTHRAREVEHKTQANRPVGSGAGPRRGDRRDMHPKFSTGKTHSKGGKRGPIGRSTRKGGVND